ncbi:MAG: hypothetical protein V1800_01570 [Candidatus Latescibacterota bacterium]
MVNDYRASVRLAMEFIGQAYIQDQGHPDYHGFYHMYDSRTGKWNYAYMELAWQVIYDALLPYHQYTGETRWLAQAERMILDWGIPKLMCADRASQAYGGMLLNNSPETQTELYGDCYHTFDCGDGLLAFLMVYERTGDPAVLGGAKRISGFLRRATSPDHHVRMVFDARKNEWDDAPQIYPASRAAWAYAYWYRLTGEGKYREWADEYGRWILSQQRPNGFLSPKDPEVAEFMIYAIEGLYWAGIFCGNEAFVQGAKRSFDGLLAARKSGPGNLYFYYHADGSPDPCCVEADARSAEKDMLSTCGQVAKLAHYFHQRTGEARYRRAYLEALDFMYGMQDRTSRDPNMLGGWPRATNHAWTRSVCPAYNYVGAVLLDERLLDCE